MITTRPTIPAARYGERLAAARSLAADAGFAAILVGVGADMRYLAGYPAMPLERLTMLVIPTRGDMALVAPRLEATPARSCPPAAAGTAAGRHLGRDRRPACARRVDGACRRRSEVTLRIAVSDDLPARHLLRLQQRLAGGAVRAGIADPAVSSGSSRTPTRSRC